MKITEEREPFKTMKPKKIKKKINEALRLLICIFFLILSFCFFMTFLRPTFVCFYDLILITIELMVLTKPIVEKQSFLDYYSLHYL